MVGGGTSPKVRLSRWCSRDMSLKVSLEVNGGIWGN